MNSRSIDSIIREYADEIKEDIIGYWEFVYQEFFVLVITDENHNRLRIISPITPEKKLSSKTLRTCMAANFDRALDARYAISKDYLWSAFIHPLKELTDGQFIDALNQVVSLATNYGTTYTSSGLLFGGENDVE